MKGSHEGKETVIFLTKSKVFGGCEKLLIEYVKRIDHEKYSVTIFSTHDVFSKEFCLLSLPVPVVLFPFKLTGTRFMNFFNLFNFIKKWGWGNKIIIFQGAFQVFKWPEYLAAYMISRGNAFSVENSGPLVNTRGAKNILNLILTKKNIFFLQLRAKMCKRVLAVSDEVKSRLVEWYDYPLKKTVVAHSGVDSEIFREDAIKRTKMRTELGIPQDETVIISTARLSKEKRVDRLIEAFENIFDKKEKCILLIMGSGPEESAIKKLINVSRAKEKILVLGFRENVADYLKMSDIFVLSSDMEGFSIAMLEAMAAGLMIVRTKTCGAQEILIHNKNGLLAECSVGNLSEMLLQAIQLDTKTKQEFRLYNINLIEKSFKISTNIQKALGFLDITVS